MTRVVETNSEPPKDSLRGFETGADSIICVSWRWVVSEAVDAWVRKEKSILDDAPFSSTPERQEDAAALHRSLPIFARLRPRVEPDDDGARVVGSADRLLLHEHARQAEVPRDLVDALAFRQEPLKHE